MIVDQQLKKLPNCEGCGHPEGGIVYYGTLLICGNCVVKLQQKKDKENKQYLLEEGL